MDIKYKIKRTTKVIKFKIQKYYSSKADKLEKKIDKKKIKQKKYLEKLNKEDNTQLNMAPKVLTKDIDKVRPYIDRLQAGIETDDVFNIALMGPYGSGKSTILKTFQYENPQYNYLNLSLASFSTNRENEYEKDKGQEEGQEAIGQKEGQEAIGQKEKVEYKIDAQPNSKLYEKLENSLVKQMIYRPKSNQIPFSRFKKIKKIPKWSSFFYYMSSILLGISIFYFKQSINF